MKSKLNLLKNGRLIFSAVILMGLFSCSQSNEATESNSDGNKTENVLASAREEPSSDAIQWLGIEEALAAQRENPKPLFIDVYTDWCHWCKVMDSKTFSRPEVARYMNENFHPVKFNAEKEAPLTFRGQEFKVVDAGRRGIHTFAYAILDGRMSYPSYVILDNQLQRLGIIKGFKEAEPFLQELKQVR